VSPVHCATLPLTSHLVAGLAVCFPAQLPVKTSNPVKRTGSHKWRLQSGCSALSLRQLRAPALRCTHIMLRHVSRIEGVC
jgi:hypothetical protein